jgi:hypothetical protein
VSENNKSLTADAIRQIEDRPIEKVSTPEWGGHVFVRTLSGLEASQTKTFHESENTLALYVAMLACDDKGERLFTVEDADWLGEKDSDVLLRICDAGRIFNSMDAESAETLAKN